MTFPPHTPDPTKDAFAQVINLLTTTIRASEAREARTHAQIEGLRSEMDKRFDRQDAQIAHLVDSNARQDRLAGRTAAVAEEGLSMAETLRADAAKAGARSGGFYGFLTAVAASIGAAAAAYFSANPGQ